MGLPAAWQPLQPAPGLLTWGGYGVREADERHLKLPVFHFSSGAENASEIILPIKIFPFPPIFPTGRDNGQNGGENVTSGQYDWGWRYGSFRASL